MTQSGISQQDTVLTGRHNSFNPQPCGSCPDCKAANSTQVQMSLQAGLLLGLQPAQICRFCYIHHRLCQPHASFPQGFPLWPYLPPLVRPSCLWLWDLPPLVRPSCLWLWDLPPLVRPSCLWLWDLPPLVRPSCLSLWDLPPLVRPSCLSLWDLPPLVRPSCLSLWGDLPHLVRPSCLSLWGDLPPLVRPSCFWLWGVSIPNGTQH